jgi:L-threonylcarbamoyladenylate synthase
MPIIPINDESIREAAAVIARGGLVAFPTETVYGLGGDAFNPLSLAKIFEVKGRPRFDPLIVHIAAFETLETIADLSLLDAAAKKNLAALTEQFWPGPLTLILPKQKTVPDLATSGLPTVAVRLPDHDAARRLIALSTGAVAAPSANPFGYLSPTRAEHVAAMLGEKIEFILDGGPARFGLESTVLDMSGEQPRILRPGAVPKEAIEALVGVVVVGPDVTNNNPASPGMLKSHYAPRVPLVTHNGEPPQVDGAACRSVACRNAAFLFFDGASRDRWLSVSLTEPKPAAVAVLSETGDLLEAAARLFQTLHEFDRPGINRIYAQLAPEKNLGIAINDRLRRAENTHGKK